MLKKLQITVLGLATGAIAFTSILPVNAGIITDLQGNVPLLAQTYRVRRVYRRPRRVRIGRYGRCYYRYRYYRGYRYRYRVCPVYRR